MSKAERPTQVWVGATPYSISYDHDELMKFNGEKQRSFLGVSNHHNLFIIIDGNAAEQVIRDTLMHEIMHCLFTEAGLAPMIGQLDEEELCSTLSPRLVSMLRVNPEVSAYLLRSTDDTE